MVGQRVWTAHSRTTVLYGTIKEVRIHNGWKEYKIDWDNKGIADEWQKCCNVSTESLHFQ